MRIFFKMAVKDFKIIGRLRSGLYTYIDNHCFFHNDCIKMRLEILNESRVEEINELDLFDVYNDIFELSEGEKILANSPISS